MALILNIDSATEKASVCISVDGKPIALKTNERQGEHASFLHAAIEQLLHETAIKLKEIEAFAVTSGPGSYTGLRVGMATAKGFCYALNKPLITINTLEVMAKAAIELVSVDNNTTLFCPMIDARRMEVFTALYSKTLHTVLTPQPLILDENIFRNYYNDYSIIYFGSGSIKFKELTNNEKGECRDIGFDAQFLGMLAENYYQMNLFSSITYSEPEYLKDFYTIKKK